MSKQNIKCRLCGREARHAFSRTILKKYKVSFYVCQQCESLQTEEPFWLEEAYADSRPIGDIGMVERNQRAQALIYFISKLLKLTDNTKILDWGGGNGLLVRMLRDVGLNAFLSDKYVTNYYAVGFENNTSFNYSMIIAFEVFEHFPYPKKDVEEMFRYKPKLLMFSTCLFQKKGADWNYIYPNSGKHVFFYSKKTIKYIADVFGYKILYGNTNHLFYKVEINSFKKRLVRLLLLNKRRRLVQTIFSLIPKKSLANKDLDILKIKDLI